MCRIHELLLGYKGAITDEQHEKCLGLLKFFEHLLPADLPSSPFHLTTRPAWACTACEYTVASPRRVLHLPLLLSSDDVGEQTGERGRDGERWGEMGRSRPSPPTMSASCSPHESPIHH